jgi:hypothetical protein
MKPIRWLLHKLRLLFLSEPSIPPEQRIKTSLCHRTRNSGDGVWLVLTSDNLILERAYGWLSILRVMPGRTNSIGLRDIIDVQELTGRWSDLMPSRPVLAIATSSGRWLYVQVEDTSGWVAAIRKAAKIDDARPAASIPPHDVAVY